MRFLKPSPGECTDRQTILQIKCRVAAQQGKPLEHFVGENNDIQRYLEQEWFPEGLIRNGARITAQYDKLQDQLRAVNQHLWDLEDEIRSIMALAKEEQVKRVWEVFRIGTSIPVFNDKRAALVAEINELFGVVSREKIYSNVMSTLKEIVNR